MRCFQYVKSFTYSPKMVKCFRNFCQICSTKKVTLMFGENFKYLELLFLNLWLNIKMDSMKISSIPNFTVFSTCKQFFNKFEKNIANKNFSPEKND